MYEVLCHSAEQFLLIAGVWLPRVLKNPPEEILHTHTHFTNNQHNTTASLPGQWRV